MPRHVHAELMMEYAQDAMENERPWELWELEVGKLGWTTLKKTPQWHPENEYRRKPKTVNINGFEVVQELFEEADPESNCFVEDASDLEFYFEGKISSHRVLRGIAHKTKESAVASCKARLGIDPNS